MNEEKVLFRPKWPLLAGSLLILVSAVIDWKSTLYTCQPFNLFSAFFAWCGFAVLVIASLRYAKVRNWTLSVHHPFKSSFTVLALGLVAGVFYFVAAWVSMIFVMIILTLLSKFFGLKL